MALGAEFRYDFAVASIETSEDGPAVVIGENGERIEADVVRLSFSFLLHC